MILKGEKEISKYLHMSLPTFRRHKNVDAIPYMQLQKRGKVLSNTEWLDEWMQKQAWTDRREGKWR